MPGATNITLDDHVDDEIAACLSLDEPRSFFLFAGAGSGKTRSLVSALSYIRKTHGQWLALRGQQVGVVTYTNAARDEIVRRTESSPLFHVSTIHSLAWDLMSGFNSDIREWLRVNLKQEIDKLEAEEARGRKGTKASTDRQAKIEAKGRRLVALDEIREFIYSATGDNGEKNALGHAEVIKMCSDFLSKPTMQKILVTHYPFLLIDESQDAHRELVDALLVVQATHSSSFCMGLIGDTMQRIYTDGKEAMERAVPEDWEKPAKVLNHRCPRRVVRLINQVRSEVDDHLQEPRTDSAEGFVRLFVCQSDRSLDKDVLEGTVRGQMADLTGDPKWADWDECKSLTLEHHMAARRMGFEEVFGPLYQVDKFKTGLLDGKLPIIRLFTQDVLPLVEAQSREDQFTTARVIRDRSPLLSRVAIETATEQRAQLETAKDAVDMLWLLWNAHEPTCGEVLENVAASGLFAIPDGLRPALALRKSRDATPSDADSLASDTAAVGRFLDAPFAQIRLYQQYISHAAPFDTHQGVKGLEFERVMVVMDDTEARGFMFGYEKLFGAKELSGTDLENHASGKETGLDRTRRLFYVTCSRARQSLALVVYSASPDLVRAHVLESGWFDEQEVVLM